MTPETSQAIRRQLRVLGYTPGTVEWDGALAAARVHADRLATQSKPVELAFNPGDGKKMLDFIRAQIAAKAEPRKTVTLAFEDAQRLFDLATDSPLVCSGSFETDDVVVLRRLAETIGVDPNRATPDEFAAQYPHPFKRRHVYAEMRYNETGPEAQARIAEERADPKCQAGTYGRRCGKLADDPIHPATEVGA